MGLFSGSKRSYTTVNNNDSSVAAAGEAQITQIEGAGNTINDPKFLIDGLDRITTQLGKTTDFAKSTQANALSLLAQADDTTGSNRLILFGLIAVGAVAAIGIYTR